METWRLLAAQRLAKLLLSIAGHQIGRHALVKRRACRVCRRQGGLQQTAGAECQTGAEMGRAMVVSRRDLLAGGSAAAAIGLMAPRVALAASAARRDFVITLGRREIGASSVALRRSGNNINLAVDLLLSG